MYFIYIYIYIYIYRERDIEREIGHIYITISRDVPTTPRSAGRGRPEAGPNERYREVSQTNISIDLYMYI